MLFFHKPVYPTMAVKNTQIYEFMKMDLQVKKLKVDISATPKKNSDTGSYHHPQGRDKLLIPPVKEED